jgi:SnoaL-like domain
VAEHPDVERFRQAFEGDTIQDVLADGADWHGRGAGGGPDSSVREVYADGTHTVAWLDRSANGRTEQQAVVFEMEGDKAKEVWSIPTDAEVAHALDHGHPVDDHRNLPVFRTAEETRGRNTFEPEDLANISAFLREDVHWISPWGEGPSSRDECIAQFQQFKAATGGTIHMDVYATFADDKHAVSFVELTAKRPDKPERSMDIKEVNLFHLDENGQAYEFWGIQDDTAKTDEFWAP